MRNPEYAKIVMKGKVGLDEYDAAAFKLYLASYQAELSAFQAGLTEQSPETFYSRWMQINPFYFSLVRNGTPVLKGNIVVDNSAKSAQKSWNSLSRETAAVRRDMKKKTLHGSVLGVLGKALEPLSQVAGMNWRVNIAVIGSFAAKEALVSTLGTIYSIESDAHSDEGNSLRSGLAQEGGFRSLHALAIMIFIAFFPPCIATMMMIKVESGSVKWLIFAVIYPIIFGFITSSLVFQMGLLLGF
jgi:ferrous iron transport protein B